MLQQAAQRRREHKQSQRIVDLKHRNTRLENDRNRIEREVIRDRMAGISGTPGSSAYIDNMLENLFRQCVRETAIKILRDPAASSHLEYTLRMAAQLLSNDTMHRSIWDVQVGKSICVELVECLFERGLELQVTVPTMQIRSKLPIDAILHGR